MVSYSPSDQLRPSSCLGRTCLKWGDNGELSDGDAQLILQRLVQVDRQAAALLERLPERVTARSLGIG
ncbi:MAG: hypothetical protein QUV07_06020 [Cyanobium sp. CZS 25K]|nr:hypothetical protein [Cyanobium sp. CZS25K]